MIQMTDFIEIDFIEAGERGSGDAITIRCRRGISEFIYVIDGGYTNDGNKIVDHIRKYYGVNYTINHLVLTHSDNDHASGLVTVLEKMNVECLWMNRPWMHVDQLLLMIDRYQDRGRLTAYLKDIFSNVAKLEELALSKGILIRDAFWGDTIGEFTVLSPRRDTYIELIVGSDTTSASADRRITQHAKSTSDANWGEENLKGDTEGTSRENETSIVQFAEVCGKTILLTSDAGVRALREAYQAAHLMGKSIGPLDWFQVPHHGSRRNVSTDVLNAWLGDILPEGHTPPNGKMAIISANQNDSEHPKKAVIRAMIHRGRRVFQTTGTLRIPSDNAPPRDCWAKAVPLEYPHGQED